MQLDRIRWRSSQEISSQIAWSCRILANLARRLLTLQSFTESCQRSLEILSNLIRGSVMSGKVRRHANRTEISKLLHQQILFGPSFSEASQLRQWENTCQEWSIVSTEFQWLYFLSRDGSIDRNDSFHASNLVIWFSANLLASYSPAGYSTAASSCYVLSPVPCRFIVASINHEYLRSHASLSLIFETIASFGLTL